MFRKSIATTADQLAKESIKMNQKFAHENVRSLIPKKMMANPTPVKYMFQKSINSLSKSTI